MIREECKKGETVARPKIVNFQKYKALPKVDGFMYIKLRISKSKKHEWLNPIKITNTVLIEKILATFGQAHPNKKYRI